MYVQFRTDEENNNRVECFQEIFTCLNIFLDTFASKTAAIQDETADASVGNVTGSNAVNVFLGIGIAWSMAAIYHEASGKYKKFV